MANGKKIKIDGISLSIVILNILIVGVLITLCTLIYLYMTGKLEDTNVANMGLETESAAMITTTPLTSAEPEESEAAGEADTDEEGDLEVTDDGEADAYIDEDFDTTDDGEAQAQLDSVSLMSYDEDFFKDDFFIGDSIYTGLVNYGYFPSEQVFAQIGLNPESARTKQYSGYTSVTMAASKQPKRIFIMLGSNGLAYMGNTHMIEQMKLLTEELKEACPESFIYIISIPPVTKEHESEGQETMSMVNGYNKLLKEMAQETGVVFLDLCSQLEDSTGYFSADYAEADGLHFLAAGYKKMLSFFQSSIEG